MCIGGVDTSKHDSAGKSSSNKERRGEASAGHSVARWRGNPGDLPLRLSGYQ